MTEKEKMLAGEIYNANYDEELIKRKIFILEEHWIMNFHMEMK